MSNNSEHHRRSIRLQQYDYAQAGAYFVTICIYEHACLLGDIINGEMRMNAAGQLVADTWTHLPVRFPCIELDAFVVMPNHLHGVLVLSDPPATVGAGLALPNNASDFKKQGTPRSAPTLADVVGAFKSISAIACNRLLNRSGCPFWQRNYYEHVIRHEKDLERIREYIENNPGRWAEDKENSANWT